MPADLQTELSKFYTTFKFNSKGKLSVALVVTQHARKMGLSLDPDKLVTDGGGQVYGLGKNAVQAILHKHGIAKVLAQEGGRTSRGSISAMKDYFAFLKTLEEFNVIDFDAIEGFWISKVKLFFAAKPLKVRLDSAQSLRTLVSDLLQQGEAKQKESQGVYYVGAILQHLVGAKLDCAIGIGRFSHNSFSTSDLQRGRSGDFVIDKVVIHVTATPTESLIGRCKDNLERGLRPILVTTKKRLELAEGLAENVKLAGRIDIFEIEQFIALNLFEFSKFQEAERIVAVNKLVDRYNEIVSTYETDPSLQIDVL